MKVFEYKFPRGIKINPLAGFTERKGAVRAARAWVGDRNISVFSHSWQLADELAYKHGEVFATDIVEFAGKLLGNTGQILILAVLFPLIIVSVVMLFFVLLPHGYASSVLANKILKHKIKASRKV
jgi:hypothetical protein